LWVAWGGEVIFFWVVGEKKIKRKAPIFTKPKGECEDVTGQDSQQNDIASLSGIAYLQGKEVGCGK